MKGTVVGKDSQGNSLGALSGATLTISGRGSFAALSDGTFEVANLSAGNYTLSASKVGYHSTTKSITLEQGVTASQTIFLTIICNSSVLKGTVVEKDSQGKPLNPLSGVSVQITGVGSVVTGANGTYQFSNLLSGTYAVTASKTGFYSATKSIPIGQCVTKDEIFYVTKKASNPEAYNFRSPNGKHFIEKMPGNLTFETNVDWNGAPGSVKFLVAGQWKNATITSLGGELAKAVLTVPSPLSIGVCSELMIEVVNGDGLRASKTTGVFFHPVPGIIPVWFGEGISWASSGSKIIYKNTDLQFPIYPEIKAGSFKLGFYSRVGDKLSFDPFAGAYSGNLTISFGAEMKGPPTPVYGARFLGKAQGNFGGGLTSTFSGCQTARYNPSWNLGCSGKTGVGLPAATFASILVPPVAPAITTLQGIPVVKNVVNALEARFYFVPGFNFKGNYGTYPNIQFGNKFLWAKTINGQVNLGAEIQGGVSLYSAYVFAYGGGNGTFPAEMPIRISKLNGYAGVNAGYKTYMYKKEYGFTYSFEQNARALEYFEPDIAGGTDWIPIGSSLSAWGDANRPAAPEKPRQLMPIVLKQDVAPEQNEYAIVENVTTVSTPWLAADTNGASVEFTLHHTDKPWYAATDIAEARTMDGKTWSINSITDDMNAEFTPKATKLSQTQNLSAWMRIHGDVSNAEDPAAIAPYQEIAASWQDTTTKTWAAAVRVTNNDLVDRDPLPVAFGLNQGIIWIQNESDLELGNTESGDRLLFVPCAGSTWGNPQTLWAGKKGILDFSFAEDGQGRGHIAFAVDEDGNPDTREDREIYLISTAGAEFQPAVRLTQDKLEDALPTLSAPNGAAMIIWNKGGELYYAWLDQFNPGAVFAEETDSSKASSLAVATMPAGTAIAYTSNSSEGTDIFAVFYDALLDRWSLPRQLTHDESVESSLSLAFDGYQLIMAYLKTQIIHTDVDVQIEGEMEHFENMPQPAQTDLYILYHPIGDYLAVTTGSLIFDPENPAPGSSATIKAIVQNNGDFPVQDVTVAFYDGDPDDGGILIGQSAVAGPLVAGDQAETLVDWDIPETFSTHHIYVVVDPDLAIDDRDRTNNSTAAWVSQPELTIETAWSDPISSTTLSLTAKVVNMGVIPSGSFEVAWRLDSPEGNEIGRTTVESITPGGENEVSLLWDVQAPVQPGQFVPVYVVIDPDDSITESDETDNLAPQSVETPMYTDHVGMLTVNIMPQEAIDAGVKWSYDGGVTWLDSGTQLTLLAGRYSITFSETDEWTLRALHNVEVLAGQERLVIRGESSPGDVNADGDMNLADAVIALKVIAGMETTEVYAQADTSGDEKIGVEDVVYILQKAAGLR